MNRFYCVVNGRKVHYRKVGQGPALVMLHASPVSSQVYTKDYLPVFSRHFTCIVPDAPGNGHSDPIALDREAGISDYADALRDFLDTIGVSECLLYGRHTGALIAVEFAVQNPDRTRFVYCDGFPVFTKEEIASYTGSYLKSFEPDWSGGFLSWLWFRYRDQHVFWPWHIQDSEHLSDTNVPDLDFLQAGTLDLLISGNNYLHSYLAAFSYAENPKFSQVKPPVCYAVRPGDVLFGIQDRLVDLPENAWMQEIARETEQAVHQELEILLKYREGTPTSVLRVAQPQPASRTPMFVGSDQEQIFCRYNKAQDITKKNPLIIIPPVSAGGGYLDSLNEAHQNNRDVIIFDPPGHGDSDFNGEHTIENYSEKLSEVMIKLDIRDFDVAAYGSGALIALEIQKLLRPAVIEVDPNICLDSSYQSVNADLDFSLSWDGTHLIKLWHYMRDTTIWRGWNNRSCDNYLDGNWDLSLTKQYIKFVDAVKSIGTHLNGIEAVSKYEFDSEIFVQSDTFIERPKMYNEL